MAWYARESGLTIDAKLWAQRQVWEGPPHSRSTKAMGRRKQGKGDFKRFLP